MPQSARMRTRHRSGLLVLRRGLVLAAAGLTLVGCGGEVGSTAPADDESTTAKATPKPARTAPASTDSEDEPEAPDPADGEVSPPGTQVALGKPVTLPISSGTSKKGIASITVQLEKGSAADLKPLNLGERAKGLIPYYARITFRKVDGKELAFGEYSAGFKGFLPDGSIAGQLSAPGWDKCGIESAPEPFDTGKPYETCRPFLAPEESEVASVGYEADYDSEYSDKPVIWQ